MNINIKFDAVTFKSLFRVLSTEKSKNEKISGEKLSKILPEFFYLNFSRFLSHFCVIVINVEPHPNIDKKLSIHFFSPLTHSKMRNCKTAKRTINFIWNDEFFFIPIKPCRSLNHWNDNASSDFLSLNISLMAIYHMKGMLLENNSF